MNTRIPPAIARRRALRLLALAATPLLAAGCASQVANPLKGYTACNLWEYRGWVYSGNVLHEGSLIPLGTPIELTTIKRSYYVYGTIGGRDLAIRDDSSSGEAETMAWARRLVSAENPATKVATWPPEVQVAVRNARATVGMTREQVIASLGVPSPGYVRSLDLSLWRYDLGGAVTGSVFLKFEGDRLVGVQGDQQSVGRVEYRP